MSLRELTNEAIFGSASAWRLALRGLSLYLCTSGVSEAHTHFLLRQWVPEGMVSSHLSTWVLDTNVKACRVAKTPRSRLTLAVCLLPQWVLGRRKAVWFSCSADLMVDATRVCCPPHTLQPSRIELVFDVVWVRQIHPKGTMGTGTTVFERIRHI